MLRSRRVAPRRLGHVALGSTDYEAARAFFLDGLGFRLSDEITAGAAHVRCSSDHHNVLVMRAPTPFLHHTAWQVEDVDEVGRGARAVLEEHPGRHVWGPGRHRTGSNFFWYLRDPAGNLCEYYSDMDCVVDDQVWVPESLDETGALCGWGPPPRPPSWRRRPPPRPPRRPPRLPPPLLPAPPPLSPPPPHRR
ncbi:VOC family protein [Streptomyces sp. M19]